MRVAHVITRLIVGGAQENTVASVLGLRGYPDLEIELISGPTSGPEGSLEHLCSFVPGLLTVVPELVRPVHPLKDFLALRQLTRIFLERKPDLVHTHSGKAGVLGRLAAERAGVPVVIHTIHGPSFGPFQSSFANLIFRAAEKRASRSTTHFVAVAEAMARQYIGSGIGHAEQYSTILSGFDLKPFLNARNDTALRARLGIGPDDVVVSKIARLFRLKGHQDLLEIAPALVAQCPSIKFLLVGDGPWRGRFQRLAREKGVASHFVFSGLVPPDQVPALLGISDIVVHLSRREGLPRALPQGMAAGRPVIAFDCDGAREVCHNNQTGFLVPAGDLKELKARILQLANAPELRARLGANGRDFVSQRFSVARMVSDLYSLYRRLLDRAGRASSVASPALSATTNGRERA